LYRAAAGLAKIFGLDKYPRGYQNYLLYIFQAGRRLDQPMDINAGISLH
jgi:hypothetical protein